MRDKKGFTLAELLVVVAIIGVLVAISIPVFTSQIHKAEVATDWANVRSYYSQLQYDFMETGTVKEEYLNEAGKPGLTSFQLTGQTVKLKAGSIWIAPEDKNNVAGYNIYYACNNHHIGSSSDNHQKCILILPEDKK